MWLVFLFDEYQMHPANLFYKQFRQVFCKCLDDGIHSVCLLVLGDIVDVFVISVGAFSHGVLVSIKHIVFDLLDQVMSLCYIYNTY